MAYETSLKTDDTAHEGARVVQETVDVMQSLAGELNHAAEGIKLTRCDRQSSKAFSVYAKRSILT
jgi:hypothetical protein